MIEKVNEPVSVNLVFNSKSKKVYPHFIRWRGRLYKIDKIGLHHFFRRGRTLFHIFSVASQDCFFRLSLNTENLNWTLEEVADDIIN